MLAYVVVGGDGSDVGDDVVIVVVPAAGGCCSRVAVVIAAATEIALHSSSAAAGAAAAAAEANVQSFKIRLLESLSILARRASHSNCPVNLASDDDLHSRSQTRRNVCSVHEFKRCDKNK